MVKIGNLSSNGVSVNNGGTSRPLEDQLLYASNVTLLPSAPVPFNEQITGYAGKSLRDMKITISVTLSNSTTAAIDTNVPPLENLIQTLQFSDQHNSALHDQILGHESDIQVLAALSDPRLFVQADENQGVTVPASGNITVSYDARLRFPIDVSKFPLNLQGNFAPTSVLNLPSGVTVSAFSFVVYGTFISQSVGMYYLALKNIPASVGVNTLSSYLVTRTVLLSAYGIGGNGEPVTDVLSSLAFSSNGITYELPNKTVSQIEVGLAQDFPYVNSIPAYTQSGSLGGKILSGLLILPVPAYSQVMGRTLFNPNFSSAPSTLGGTSGYIRAFWICRP